MKNGSSLEYQYNIADHQGNTRVVFSSVPGAAEAKTANFESTTNTDFLNYPGFTSNLQEYNSTESGTKSQHLHGGLHGQIGVARSYRVFPGDKIKIEAKGKYFSSSGASQYTAMATELLSAFLLSAPAPGEIGTPSAALNSYGGLIANGASPSNNNTHPKVDIIVLVRIIYPFPLPAKMYIIPLVALPAIINWLRYERNFDVSQLDVKWKGEDQKKKR